MAPVPSNQSSHVRAAYVDERSRRVGELCGFRITPPALNEMIPARSGIIMS